MKIAISVFHSANMGQYDYSNPYIESTTVLSDSVLCYSFVNNRCTYAARVTVFERYGMKTNKNMPNQPICLNSAGLRGPGSAHLAHRVQIKLLRGYVSKSSAALNPLMITQLDCACER